MVSPWCSREGIAVNHVIYVEHAKVISGDIEGQHLPPKDLLPHRDRPLVSRLREERAHTWINQHISGVWGDRIAFERAEIHCAEFSFERRSTLRRLVTHESVSSVAHLLLYECHGAGRRAVSCHGLCRDLVNERVRYGAFGLRGRTVDEDQALDLDTSGYQSSRDLKR